MPISQDKESGEYKYEVTSPASHLPILRRGVEITNREASWVGFELSPGEWRKLDILYYVIETL